MSEVEEDLKARLKLRAARVFGPGVPIEQEALDRIIELEAENRRLREALEHFVEALNDWECGDERDADCIASQPVASIITFGHLRRARAVLNGEQIMQELADVSQDLDME